MRSRLTTPCITVSSCHAPWISIVWVNYNKTVLGNYSDSVAYYSTSIYRVFNLKVDR
jgi:hypothetical protein